MARKISLREFQESVVAKLQSLVNSAQTQSSLRLGVLAGAQHWLVNLAEVSEVVPLPALCPVPLAHPWFAGVANVRGNLYGIVDFSAFSGDTPYAAGTETRLLLAHPRFAVNTGLVVSRLLGLRNPEQMQPRKPEENVRPWVAAEYMDEEGRSWKELDVATLLKDQGFLQAGL